MTATAPSRGVYRAERASALAGVPLSTVYEWARKAVVVPSISDEKIKLWSWTDLVALRAVYWLRHPSGGRKATSMPQVKSILSLLQGTTDGAGLALATGQVWLAVDANGRPHLSFGENFVVPQERSFQLAAQELLTNLLAPFSSVEGALGPDLVHPGEGLMIIPGKLSGEPHIEGTRIETRVLWALRERGFDAEGIRRLYPELSLRHVESALSLELRLQRNLRAA